MNRRFLRITLIALVALVALASVISGLSAGNGKIANPAGDPELTNPLEYATYAEGTCTSDGVTVVVDFGNASKRAPIERCVVGSNLTGWQILQVAQLTPTGTSQYPVGFLCRLSGYPTEDKQDCLNTPKSGEGSWSYFFASAANTSGWQYAPIGAATRKPQCGDFEGWLFTDSVDYEPQLSPSIVAAPFECAN